MGLDNGIKLFRYKGKDPPKNKLRILNNYINNYVGIEKEKDEDAKNFEKIYIGKLKRFLSGYEETFKTSELGRIKSLLPLREMAISFGLIEEKPKRL